MSRSATELAGGCSGWPSRELEVRAAVSLCPQGLSDGELIGVARILRSLVGERVDPAARRQTWGYGGLLTLPLPKEV